MWYQVHLAMGQDTLTSAQAAVMETTYNDYKCDIFMNI